MDLRQLTRVVHCGWPLATLKRKLNTFNACGKGGGVDWRGVVDLRQLTRVVHCGWTLAIFSDTDSCIACGQGGVADWQGWCGLASTGQGGPLRAAFGHFFS